MTHGELAVVLTGGVGRRKTSVLTALSDALTEDEVPHAASEVEALAWTHATLDLGQRRRTAQSSAGPAASPRGGCETGSS